MLPSDRSIELNDYRICVSLSFGVTAICVTSLIAKKCCWVCRRGGVAYIGVHIMVTAFDQSVYM